MTKTKKLHKDKLWNFFVSADNFGEPQGGQVETLFEVLEDIAPKLKALGILAN